MKGILVWLGLAGSACFLCAATLNGCAPLQLHPSRPPVPATATATALSAGRSAGAKVFDKWCSDCHSTPGGPGSMALQRKYQGNVSAILEQRSDLRPDYIKMAVRKGVSFMPSFRKTEISDSDLALVAAYLAPSH